MTSEKRRQRGSRTYSGSTHKNRHSAGHRDGRGRAGRDKYELHDHKSPGKHDFKRPDVLQNDVAEVKAQKLDEDVTLPAANGVAGKGGDTHVIDARDVAEDGWEADVVKVLGGGQVRSELHVVAGAFMAGAVELIEETSGGAELSERAEEAAEAGESTDVGEGDEE